MVKINRKKQIEKEKEQNQDMFVKGTEPRHVRKRNRTKTCS